jgi:hypothetical protein
MKASLLLPFWKDGSDSTDIALFARSLSMLDKLTWLQYLELDAKFLNEELTASALLSCSLTSLRRVRFVVECPFRELRWLKMESPTYDWCEFRHRHLLKSGFA